MNYNLDLNDRPFRAIKEGTKKIEGRTRTSQNTFSYDALKVGDTLTFLNNVTGEILVVDILGVRHYLDTRSMLEAEGTRNVLSSGGTIEQGIESYNSFFEYKEGIVRYGIYAIEIRVK
ncbi:MAG: ASCH domain-containing protein [Candidatus Paceibacterota bacterium]|jgi:ASC-1-like (ASCH) protein